MKPTDERYRAALEIAGTLRSADYQAWFAGGCVRDLLLGISPKDYDVATSATPGEIAALFPKTVGVGGHFGVILVKMAVNPGSGAANATAIHGDCTADSREITTEVATFRHDGAYSDGRRPDTVRFSTSPEEDVQRRDFTINGMMLDPVQFDRTGDAAGATLDLVGGRSDLADGVVRAIGEARLRFNEDKLRMLRAIRFAARLGFEIEPKTAEAIREHAAEIHQVSAERVRDELTRILTEGGAARGLELLASTGLLAQVLPEALKMQGVAQPPQYHPEGDVWVHTLLLLEHLPVAPVSMTLAWAALLHDIGKPATYQPANPAIAGDRIRFNGHVEAGVRIAEVILARLRFSNDDTEQIVALIQNHMRFGDILHMKQSTLKRFLRLPRFEEHLALHRLDCLSAHGDLRLYDFAKAQYEVEPSADLRPAPLLCGDDLIAAGYRPSPQFKLMLTLAEDAQLEGTVTTREQAMELVRGHYPLPPSAL